MGFVGITIALALARKNQEVIGYDINKEVINKLKKSKSHVDEPGINSLIKKFVEESKLKFTNNISELNFDTYVICVGTPVDDKKIPNIKFLLSSLKDIKPKYKARKFNCYKIHCRYRNYKGCNYSRT